MGIQGTEPWRGGARRGSAPQRSRQLRGEIRRAAADGNSDEAGDAHDLSLLDALVRGERGAFDRLYRRFASPLRVYARGIVGDPCTADEIVLDTMTAVWQNAGRFRFRARVSTWIFGIAHHKAIDAVRDRLRHLAIAAIDAAEPPRDRSDDPLAAAGCEARSRTFQDAFRQLTHEHRETLRLAFYEELPYFEIARRMGVPANTVKSRIFYAKQRFISFISTSITNPADLL
jgi:RNA polymerase sigma-70 factor, ECF subfamily